MKSNRSLLDHLARYAAGQMWDLHQAEVLVDPGASATGADDVSNSFSLPALALRDVELGVVRGSVRLIAVVMESLGSSLTLLPPSVAPVPQRSDAALNEAGLPTSQAVSHLGPFSDVVAYALAAAWRHSFDTRVLLAPSCLSISAFLSAGTCVHIRRRFPAQCAWVWVAACVTSPATGALFSADSCSLLQRYSPPISADIARAS